MHVGPQAVTIEASVRPRTRRGVLKVDADGVKIGVNSPAEGNRANQELIELVAELSGTPKSAVTIVRGASARLKVLNIRSANPLQTSRQISERLSQDEPGRKPRRR